jgi:hypothetical protein
MLPVLRVVHIHGWGQRPLRGIGACEGLVRPYSVRSDAFKAKLGIFAVSNEQGFAAA